MWNIYTHSSRIPYLNELQVVFITPMEDSSKAWGKRCPCNLTGITDSLPVTEMINLKRLSSTWKKCELQPRWWFQPLWKTKKIISPSRGEHEKCLKPPPSNMISPTVFFLQFQDLQQHLYQVLSIPQVIPGHLRRSILRLQIQTSGLFSAIAAMVGSCNAHNDGH